MTPNLMATFALCLWPIVAIVLYWKLPVAWALSATIIGGFLLLPEGVSWDLPALPPLDKQTIPALTALVLTILTLRNRQNHHLTSGPSPNGWIPRHLLILGLTVIIILSPFATALQNTDALVYGPTVLPGLSMYDGLSIIQSTLLMLIPFLLARRFFASAEGQRILLTTIVIAALLYSFLALYEIRMSPQLHTMIYGFFPHSFGQHFRAGGWRPTVFLNHGLILAIFFCVALLAAFGLWRIRPAPERAGFLGIGIWLLLTLVLSNSLGALIIAFLFLPLVLFVPMRLQIHLAAGLSMLFLAYPMLRHSGYVPTQRILTIAESISPERAASLAFRFEHEDQLLAKAKEKPLFGWGDWGRSRIFNEWGQDISVTDGRWVIVFGSGGWIRYIADAGLLSVAILILAFRFRRYRLDSVTAILALMLAANLVDMLPNGSASPISWLMAGALAGRLELGRSTESAAVGAAEAQGPPRRTDFAFNRSRIPFDARPQPAPDGAEDTDHSQSGPRFSRFMPKQGRSI